MWSLLRPPTFLEVLLIAVLSMGQLTPQQTGPQLALGAVSTPEAGLTLQVKRSGAAAVSNSGLGTSPVALSTSPTATVGWGVLNTTWSTDTNDALQLRTNASGNTGLIEMGAGTYKNANTQSGVQQFFQPTARAWGIFPGNQLGGFLNVHLGTNGSASSFVQAITELTGLTGTGPGTGGWSASNYANAEYDYAATTGDANYHNAYGDGMEAIYSAGFTHYRRYLWDYVNNRTIWYIDDAAPQTVKFDTNAPAINVWVGGGIGVGTAPVTGSTITFASFTFSNIGTVLTSNGQIGYCSDCTIANPCTGSGTGAIAKRLNGVNVCS